MSASANTATTWTRKGLEMCGNQNTSHTFVYDSNGFLLPTPTIYFDGYYSATFRCGLVTTDSQYHYDINISEEDRWTVNHVGGPVSFTYKVDDGKTIITDVHCQTFEGRDGYRVTISDYLDLLFYDEDTRMQAYHLYLKKDRVARL
jgi:hypothetical protein